VGPSIVRRRHVAKDQKLWEIKLREIYMEQEKNHRSQEGRRNLYHWIYKGHVVEIHGLQRKSPLKERGFGKAKTSKVEALRVIDLRK
jgi:hypothetical protein